MTDLSQRWQDALVQAYLLAKGERLGELRAKRARLLDDRGLHPYSLMIGEIRAYEAMEPVLKEAHFDPLLLRIQAQRDAEWDFRSEVLAEAGVTGESGD